jgi:CDGSH-type Zn-finger protein
VRDNEDVEITPYPDGPILVRGPVRVFDENGEELDLRRRTIAICRCGRSRIHPFCDGTHKKIGFQTGEDAPTRIDPVPQAPPG